MKMNSNDTLKEIAKQLLAAKKILLYPHILMDGDTLGSSVALCKALRSKGKTAHILIEDEVPSYLRFLDKEYCTYEKDLVKIPDVCVCVDCGDIGRFALRKEKFMEGKTTVCIDHHATTKAFADYNYIDTGAAATGEIIYKLIKEMDIPVDKEMGEALYAAITTDTGNFQYSNTTKDTLLIVVDLFDIGIEHNKVSIELYENISLQRLLINSRILETMETFAGGKAVIAQVSQKMLKEAEASMDETEGVVQTLRSIGGVEIAAFLKEIGNGKIKVGMRAKTIGDVAVIAETFMGGGHVKAAGCTIEGSLPEVKKMIMGEIEKQLTLIGNEED